MVRREEIIGDCRLLLGDCLDLLPTLGKFDAVVTDPPYGVDFSGKGGAYRNNRAAKRDDTYQSYDDTPENFAAVVIPAIKMAIDASGCGLVFMASRNVQKLPHGELGGIYMPSGTGLSSWGFQNFMHAVYYGKDPYLAAGRGCRPNGRYGLWGNDSNEIKHPCAKPLAAMEWAVERASLDGAHILDPFMGSGTTGVACVKLGRKFTGIEIDPHYFEVACERIRQAYKQPDLFVEKPKPLKQEAMQL